MTEKEKIARLVLRFDSRHAVDHNAYLFDIDMGNFCTNKDDVVFIKVDHASSILVGTNTMAMSGSNRYPVQQLPAIELHADIPQYNSYDTETQGQTSLLAIFDKNMSQEQLHAQDGPATDNEAFQEWQMKRPLEYITCRPEVLQQKRWRCTLKFAGYANIYDYMDYSIPFTVVLSVTK